jgi:hypothetical protein
MGYTWDMTDRLDHARVRDILWQVRNDRYDGDTEDAIRELEAAVLPHEPVAGSLTEAIAGSQLLAEGDPQARMDAYYYGFERTGFGLIDNILSAVATAGKRHHSTEGWIDDDPAWGAIDGISEEARIQAAADAAAAVLRAIKGRLERR